MPKKPTPLLAFDVAAVIKHVPRNARVLVRTAHGDEEAVSLSFKSDDDGGLVLIFSTTPPFEGVPT
jgi:hypothetical protein